MDRFLRLKKLILKLHEKIIDSKNVVMLWDFLYIVIIELNSYILLIYNNRQESKMIYVICAMAAAYVTILLTIFIKFEKGNQRRKVLYFTRKIFRIIYTVVYLTIIMLHLIRMGPFEAISNEEKIAIIYNIVMFVLILMIGTISFWWKKALNMILKLNICVESKNG